MSGENPITQSRRDMTDLERVGRALLAHAGRIRWPAPGDSMRFLGRGGYDSECEQALRTFSVGQVLKVSRCEVGSFSHSVAFEGVPGTWNGVMFEIVGDGEAALAARAAGPEQPDHAPVAPSGEEGR